MPKLKVKFKHFTSVVSTSLLLSTAALNAATSTWNVDASGNWTDPGNWDLGVPTATDNANMAATLTGGVTVTLPASTTTTINNITFNSPFGYLMTGTSAVLDVNGTVFVSQEPTGINEIAANMPSPVSINCTTDGLTISGDITGSSTLTKNGAGTVVISGTTGTLSAIVINDGALSVSSAANLGGAGEVSISSPGALLVTGTFTATNSLSLEDAGIVSVVENEIFTASSALTNSGGSTQLLKQGLGTLTLSGNNSPASVSIQAQEGTVSISSPNNLTTLSFIFNGGALETTANMTLTGGFNVSTSGTFNINPLVEVTLTGSITGAGTLTKEGTGILFFPTNTAGFTGGLVLNSGTIVTTSSNNLGGTNPIVFGTSGRIEVINESISTEMPFDVQTLGVVLVDSGLTLTVIENFESAAGNFVKFGEGTLVLQGDNSAFTGGIEISRGTVRLENANALGTGGILDIRVATLEVVQDVTTDMIPTFTFEDLTSIISVDTGQTLTFSSNFGTSAGTLNKVGAGSLVLAGSNSAFTGEITLDAGDITVSNTNGTGTAHVTMTGTSNLSLTADATVSGVDGASTNTITLGNNTLTFNPSVNSVFAGIISGDGGITKQGSSFSQTLSAANNYTGATTVNGGELALTGAGTIGEGSSDLITNTGRFDIAAITPATGITVGNLSGIGGVIDLGAKSLTINQANTEEYFGSIQGTGGSFIKNGAGTLTLAGTNTYTGTTTINEGTIAISSAGNLPTGPLVFDGATLSVIGEVGTISNSITFTGAGTISVDTGLSVDLTADTGGGSGLFTKTGNGSLEIAGDYSGYSGSFSLEGGTLLVTTTNNLGGAENIIFDGGTLRTSTNAVNYGAVINITGSATVQTDSTFTALVASTLTGSGTLTKTGASQFAVNSSATTFNGDVILNEGSMQVDVDTAAAWNSLTTLNDSIFNLAVSWSVGTLTGDAASSISNQGVTDKTLTVTQGLGENTNFQGTLSDANESLSLVQNGPGTLTLSGSVNYGGSTTLSDGTLILSGTQSFIGNDTTSALTMSGDAALTLSSGAGSRTIGELTGAAGNVIELNANALIVDQDTGPSTYAGVIQGTGGSFTKSGTGTIVLTGVNTYTGTTTLNAGGLTLTGLGTIGTSGTAVVVNGGTLDITGITPVTGIAIGDLSGTGGTIALGNKSLTVNQLNGLEFQGSITGTGAVLNKNGAGNLTLSGANTYTGSTSINAGTLSISSATNLGGEGPIILNDGATLSVTGTIADLPNAFGLTGNTTLNVTTGNALTLTSGFSFGSTGNLIKTGAGGLTLQVANSNYSGTTFLNEGSITTEDAVSLGSGPLTMSSDATLSMSSDLGVGTLTSASTSNEISTGGNTITVTQADAADTTYAGDITGSGGFTKAGNGTLTFSSSTAYTGATTLGAGTLQISTAGNLGGGGALVFNGGTLGVTSTIATLPNVVTMTGNGTLDLTGDLTLSSNFGTGAGTLTKTGAGVLTLSGDNSNFTGDIVHSQSTLIADSTNSLANVGNFTFNGGNLEVPTASVTSTMSPILTQAASIDVSSGLTLNIQGAFGVGAATLTKTGTGVLLIGASSANYTGDMLINAGTLACSNTNSLAGSGGLTLNGGNLSASTDITTPKIVTLSQASTISVSGASNLTLSGDLATSSQVLTKDGTGTLTLSGTNTNYTGDYLLTGGALSVGSNDNLGSGDITFAGGELNVTGNTSTSRTVTFQTASTGEISVTTGNTLTLTGDFGTGNGELITSTAHEGTLVLSGDNSNFGGSIDLQGPGTLSVSAANGLGTGGELSFSNASATLNISQTLSSDKQFNLNTTGTIDVDTDQTFTSTGNFVSPFQTLTKSGAGTLVLSGNNSNFTGFVRMTGGLLQTENSTNLSGDETTALFFDGGNLSVQTQDITTAMIPVLGQAATITTGSNLTLTSAFETSNQTLTKEGAGTLTLSGVNDAFTGDINLNAGTIAVSANSNLGASGALTFNGGTLSVTETIADLTKTVTMTGDGTIAVNATKTLSISNDFATGTGNLSITGPGDLSLSGDNSNYSGTTTISGGTVTTSTNSGALGVGPVAMSNSSNITLSDPLNIGPLSSTGSDNTITLGANTLTISQSSTGTFGGIISGTGGVTQDGGGILTLTNANDYTGTTILSNGGVILSGTDAALGNNANLSMTAGANLTLVDDSGTKSIGTLTGAGGNSISLGNNTLSITQSSSSAYGGTFSGAGGGITKAGAGTLTLTGSNSNTGTTTLSAGPLTISGSGTIGTSAASLTVNGGTFTFSGITAAGLTIDQLNGSGGSIAMGTKNLTANSGSYSGTLAGSGGLIKESAGNLTLEGDNTTAGYTGESLLTAGTLAMSNAGALGSGAVTMSNSANLTLNTNATIGTLSGSIDSTINTQPGGTGFTLTVTQATGAEFSGVISGTLGGLTTSGAGVLTLTGINTYGGTTTIGLGGGIILSDTGTLGNGTGDVVLGNSTNLTIATDAGTKNIGTLSGGVGSTIQLNNNILSITQGADQECGAAISGTGGLTVGGTNTLTLTSATNSYEGNTQINDTAGVTLSGNGILGDGTSPLTVGSNATFTIAPLAGNKSIGRLSGAGSVELNENTLTINQSSTQSFNGIIGGSGGITKQGTENLILTGANDYTGLTTLSVGQTTLSGVDAALGNGADLTLENTASLSISDNAGTKTVGTLTGAAGNVIRINANSGLTVIQGSDQIYAGTFGEAGTFTKAGGSNLTFTGDNSDFDGNTALTDGTLTLSNANAISASPLTMSNAADLTLTTDATVTDLAGAGTNTVTLGTNTLTVQQIGNTTFAGSISGTGAAGLTKIGVGSLSLSGDNTGYPGPTTISTGTLSLSAANNIGTGQLVLNGGTLEVTTDGVDLTNVVNVNAPSTVNTDTNISLTLSSNFATATEDLTKSGAGSLLLSGNNSNYSGEALITEGSINLVNSNALVSSRVNVSSGASLTMTTNASIKALTGASGSSVDTNGNNFTIDQDVGTTFAGVISGSNIQLTKSGNSNLILTGANDYTGTTLLTNGTLTLSGANSSLGNESNLTLSGNAGFSLATDAGSKTIGNLAAASDGCFISLNNNTLTINQSSTQTFGGSIGGEAASVLNKAGSATLILTGLNTQTGTVNIVDGSISLSGTNATLGGTALNITAGKNLTLLEDAGAKEVGTLTGGANSTITLNNNDLLIGQDDDSTFSGIISGTGGISKSGNGILTLDDANNYTGNTSISGGQIILSGASATLGNSSNLGLVNNAILDIQTGAGTTTIGNLSGGAASTINLNNGTLAVNQTTLSSFQGNITGAGGFTKLGSGSLGILGDCDYAGPTTITAGRLGVLGSIDNTTVTIGSSGTLLGTGSTGPVINNGTVAPGASIGTLTINGDYTQNGNGTLEVEIDQNENTDLLQVTGTANLNGTVQVVPETGIYLAGTTFTFLTAGTINGTFSALSQPSDFTFSLRYTGTTVSIVLAKNVNILPVPISQLLGNPKRVADYISANGFAPTQGDLFYTLDQLERISPQDYENALIKISPLIFGALPIVNFQSDFKIADTFTKSFKRSCEYRYIKERKKRFYFKREHKKEKEVISELNEACPENSLWAEPIFYYYNQKGTNGRITNEGQPAFTNYNYGFTLGWNDIVNDQWALGVGAGYTRSNIFWEMALGNGHWDTIYLAPSFGWVSEKAYVNLLLQSSIYFYKMHRNIHYAIVRRKANHRSKSYDFLGQVEGGMKIKKQKSKFSLEPQGKFGVDTMIVEGFTEDGAQSLNLDVRRKHVTYLQVEFTLKAVREFYFDKGTFCPGIYAGWVGDIPVTNGNINAKFAQEDTNRRNFHVLSYHQMINQMVLGCELPIQNYKNFSCIINYETSFFNRFQIQEARVKLSWDF